MRMVSRTGLLCLAVTAAASGNPLTWTVSNAVFDDGGSLTGTFDYDADTGAVSNWNLVTTPGTTLSGFAYTPSSSSGSYSATLNPLCAANCFQFTRSDDLLYLLLQLQSPPTDNGGQINFTLGSGSPDASYECTNCGTFRVLVSGSISAQAGQTVSFPGIPDQIFGVAPFQLAAKASSGLPVTFASITPGSCTVASGRVQLLSPGPCSVTATQSGNAVYQSATVANTFTVRLANAAGTLTAAANSPFQVGTSPNSVATGDFNGDGFPDLAVANYGANSAGPGSSVTVLLGDGSGNFTQAANSPYPVPSGQNGNSYSIAVGDFNVDGHPDIAVASVYSDNVTILLGNGDGTFTEDARSPFSVGVQTAAQPFFVTVGDFNRDGIPDLATANAANLSVSVLLGDGTGAFTPASGSPFGVGNTPESIAVGDFNGDGVQDLAVANVNSNNVSVLLGNGSGGFTSGGAIAVGSHPFSVVTGDFNGDGKPDLAAVNQGNSNVSVLLGDGAGGFSQSSGSPFSTGGSTFFGAVADFNGDGIQDLSFGNGIVLLGNGTGGFSQASANVSAGSPFVVADFNGDGIEDIAATNSGSATVTVLLGSAVATTANLSTTSPSTIVIGTNVPLTLNVADSAPTFSSPTGTVTFFDGATSLGTANQNAPPYTFTVNSPGAGNHNYSAQYGGGSGSQGSPSNTISINVLLTQTITFNPLSNQTIGVSPFTINASASSALPVSFTSNSQTVCSVSGTTVTILTTGTCSITANQAGNGTYAPANPVTQSFTVLGTQTITFDAIPNQILGISPFPVTAQSTALTPVTFASTTTNVCTVAGDLVTLLTTGTCSVTASQNGSANFAPAPSVTRSFSISASKIAGRLIPATAGPFSAGANPYSVAVGDFNADGKPDLAVANSGSNNATVLLGDGLGGFAPAASGPLTTGNAPQSVVVGDFNADGIPDLAVANSGDGSVSFFLGSNSGVFSPAAGSPFQTGTQPVALAVGDLTGDGIQDVAVANHGAASVLVLVGSGTGTTIPARAIPLTVGNGPSGIALADFNGDGMLDMAVTNSADNTVTILLNSPVNGFSEASGSPVPVGTSPSSVAVGDFNRDGFADLAIANSGGTVTVLLGDGSAGFAPSANVPSVVASGLRSIAVLDFNGDGIQDLAVTSASGFVSVLIGDGAGGFAALVGGSSFTTGANPFSIAVADFNGDGFEDIAAANQGSANVSVLLGALPIPPLVITASPTSINTTVGGSAGASLSISGGLGPYTVSSSGAPPGVSASAGGLSGSPTQPGNFQVVFNVSDSSGRSGGAAVSINVLGLTTTALPDGTAGQAFATSFGAAGGDGSYTYSASGLPSGLSLSPSGYLSGTVTAANTYSFSVSVSSGGLTAGAAVSLTIDRPRPISVSNASPGTGTVNVLYSGQVSATGGVSPYTWAINSGSLPPGISMNSSGIFSGTPTTPGAFSFGVTVTDITGGTATAAAGITIKPAPLVVTTSTLPQGMYGVPYPTQQLTVDGGVPPFTWVVSSGTLPQGLTLSTDGVLSGTPQTAAASSSGAAKLVAHATTGTSDSYTVIFTVTDHANAQSTITFPLGVRPKAPDLILTAGALTFSMSVPAANPPSSQVVGVQSTDPSQPPLTYSLTINPAASWIAVTNGTVTPDSVQVAIAPAALTLAAGSYSTKLTATCTSDACSGHTQTVTVTLNVTAAPPKLQVSTNLVSFATANTSAGLLSSPINISNSGGGTLGIASIACEASWCSAGAPISSLSGGSGAAIQVTADSTGLEPGFYRTQVDIVTSGGKGAVPVTLFIAASATMTLSPAGVQFSMLQGGAPGNPNGSFLVAVNSTTTVNWSASIVPVPGVPIPAWLVLQTPAGSSTSGQPGSVSFSIDPAAAAALAPGAYYGAIQVDSSDVNNSPADFEVVLNVAPANTPVAPDPEPGGLLFITTVGGVLPAQTVKVYSDSSSAATFQASAATLSGGNWLSVAPNSGSASSTSPGLTTVSVDPSKLSPGVYQGGVSYSLSATAVRTVNVTLILAPAAGSSSSALSANASPHSVACTPSALVPAQTGLVSSFSQPAGWPTPLQILLSTDCGTAVSNGQVVATFSNGDPPLILPVTNPSQGLYSGTWSPARASSQVSINVTANAPGFKAATSQIAGAVVPNAVPVITPNGTVHSFAPLVGASLAPGTIVAIYGQYLAGSAGQPTTIPLPTTFNGTSVLIGGIQAPLYYVSPAQINAQIPFELAPGSQYDVLISANGALTNPQPIQLTATTPGLAAFSDGTLIAQHNTDGSVVSSTSPARGGEYLIAYLAGMGDTNVTVPSGTASPSAPLAQPQDPPVLTINGSPYPIAFAGLTPGLVGLYQMNFQVPTGLAAGNLTVVVSQSGASSNQTLLPYQP